MSRLDFIISTTGEYRRVPPIVCADGFSLSVQASNGHYCTDANGSRDHYWGQGEPALPYSTVEVGYPSARPEPWRCSEWHEGYDNHADHAKCDGWETYADDGESSSIYAFVPVQVVRDLIALHGGEAS